MDERRGVMRVPPALRFLVTVGALVLTFGLCGSLSLGALDKAQTHSQAPLLNLGNLVQFVGHFLHESLLVLTTYHDAAGTPFRNYFFLGLSTTLAFCFLAMPTAIVLGFFLALMSRSQRRILRVPARAFVEFFRNTPLLVQLLAIYWGLLFLPSGLLNAFTAGVATLVLNYAAYECENLRAGIRAIDRGQGEAAEALGLGYWQTLRFVTIPQMIAIVLPPVLNDLIYMFKDSSILSIISVQELTAQSTNNLVRRSVAHSWQFFLIGGLFYLALSLPLARLARAAEARLRSVSFVPKGDLAVTAAQVLLAMAAVGYLCSVPVQGLLPGTFVGNAGQVAAALGLSLTLMIATLVVLGAIAYLPARVTGLLRPRIRRRQPQGGAPEIALVSE
jgi:glutamine transport system permease protein